VARRRTTRCCSAFALIVLAATTVTAQSRRPLEHTASHVAPLTLFPVTLAWDMPLDLALQAPPAFKDARGYFPLRGDIVAAYDIRYGTLLWIAPARAQSEPALGDGLVFVVEPDGIAALHEDTGAIAWRFNLAEPLAAPLTWHNGWLIATTEAGAALALRAADGSLIWRRELGARVHAAAAVAADHAYIPMTDGRIVALRLETGEPVWEHRLGGAPNQILALDDWLYVGSNDNYFYALRTRDGEILWRWATGADVVGLPVVDERRVYFVSLDNVLRALDRYTGNQRWKRPLPLRPTRGPVVVENALVVSGISPNTPAYYMKDGTAAEGMAASGELAASPYPIAGDPLPMLILVAHDIARGTIVRALTRAIEPAVLPMTPLPNPVIPPMPTEPPSPQ
jgi:outer membrane protein assembly factor BamB